jgi:hypothetical protein
MTDPRVKERTGQKGRDRQAKEPKPSKGAGRKHKVQQRPDDQRTAPDPKEKESA